MKIFIDSASLQEIEDAKKLEVISGVTTNPSLLAKNGIGYDVVINRVLDIIEGPLSVEVDEGDSKSMYNQAIEIFNLAAEAKRQFIVIKLPMTEDGLKTCKALSKVNIATNVTLIFTLSQAILAMEAGATYISPFMGRLDNYHQNESAGYELISQIKKVKDRDGYTTKIIAASIRERRHVEQASLAGADIVTTPYKVLKQLYYHDLTKSGLEQFKIDSGK